MVKKYEKDGKVIELDDTFSIWGAIFGGFYPMYKGMMKTGLITLAINAVAAIVLGSVDSTVALIINCAIAGAVVPKLMHKQMMDEHWVEVKK